jgi:hypothetical protein
MALVECQNKMKGLVGKDCTVSYAEGKIEASATLDWPYRQVTM